MPADHMFPPVPPDADSSRDSKSTLQPHEFFLIRYFPNVIRGEFVNIGVIVREVRATDHNTLRRATVRITRDWRRLVAYFPDADLNLLEEIEEDFEQLLEDTVTGEGKVAAGFDKSLEQLSLMIQLTDSQPCLTSDIDQHARLLMHMYVDVEDDAEWLSQHALHEQLRLSFSRAQIWKRTPRGKSETYVGVGDTLLFDYLFETKETVCIIHALYAAEGTDRGLALAQRMPKLTEGIRRIHSKDLHMTVVVEPAPNSDLGSSDAEDQYRFVVATLEHAGISVLPITEVNALIEKVRTTALVLPDNVSSRAN